MKTVKLADCGQDFLEFDIDKGKIVATRPFQGWVWNGVKVFPGSIRKGKRLLLWRPGSKAPMTLNYPVVSVRERKSA